MKKQKQKNDRYTISTHFLLSIALSLLLLLFLSACEIEGGVQSPSTPGALPLAGEETPTAGQSDAQENMFRIGLLDEPGDLLPYHNDAVDQRITAPVSELLFPAPLLAHNYGYTSTGVLLRVPSFQNGDIQIMDVDVYVDEVGKLFTELPREITRTQEITIANVITHTQILTGTGAVSPTLPVSPTETVSPTLPVSPTEALPITTTLIVTETQIISTTGVVTVTEMVPVTQIVAQAKELGLTGTFTKAQQIVVTFVWNPDLFWSDGVPVTASDSVFAYELAKKWLLGPEASSRVTFLDRYVRVDEHTTRAYLKLDMLDQASDTAFHPDFTDPSYLLTFWTPLPRHLLEDVAEHDPQAWSEFAWNPVGYGPYMIDRREEGRIRLRRNPYERRTNPQADTVSFVFLPSTEALRTSLLAGNLDVAMADRIEPDQFAFLTRDQELGLLNVTYQPGPIWEHLDFNLDVPVLQDIRMRHAIAAGTNRQAMVNHLFGGQVSLLHSWIVTESWAAAPADTLKQYPYNADQAKALLDEMGLLDTNGDGRRELQNGDAFSLTLLTTAGTPLRDEVAHMFQSDMAAIGLDVHVVTMTIQALYDPLGPLFRRQFQLAQFAWIATPDPDGMALWSCHAVPDDTNNWQGNNFSGWCFRPADQAIRTATTSLSHTERLNAYATQQQLFTQELPVLPLFQRLAITLSGTAMHQVRPDPIAPVTWNIVDWRKDER